MPDLPSLDCPPPPAAVQAPAAAEQGLLERLGRWAGEKLRPDQALLRFLGLAPDTPPTLLLDYLAALAADPAGLIERKAAEVPSALVEHLSEPDNVTTLIKGVLQLQTGGMLVPAIELLQRAVQARDLACEASAVIGAGAPPAEGGDEAAGTAGVEADAHAPPPGQ